MQNLPNNRLLALALIAALLPGIARGAETGPAPVRSVAGRAGAVVLGTSDIAGLGAAATRNVGTATGTVAAGDDARITGSVAAAGGVASATIAAAVGASTIRTMADHFSDRYTSEDFAAVGDGVTDDTAHIQAGLNYLSSLGGGTLYLGRHAYLINSANLTLPSNVTLAGDLWPGNYRLSNVFSGIPYTLLLNPAYSILPQRNSGLRNILVLSKNWTQPATLAAALSEIQGYSGTVINGCVSGSPTGSSFRDLLIIGFGTAATSSCGNLYYTDVYGDDTNGILNPGGGDIGYVRDSEFFPWLAGGAAWNQVGWTVASMANNGSGAIRLTITPVTINGYTGTFGFTHAPIGFSANANIPSSYAALAGAAGITLANGNVQLTIIDDTHADIMGSTYSGSYTANSGTLYITAQNRTGIAFQDAGSTGSNFVNTFSFGYHTHLHYTTGSANATTIGDRCDGPGLDTTSICYNIDANAANVTIEGGFQSGHMIGASVSSSWTAGQHTIIQPKLSSGIIPGLTNSAYYGLQITSGNLAVIGGGIYNGTYVGDGASSLSLIGTYLSGTISYQTSTDSSKVNIIGGSGSGGGYASSNTMLNVGCTTTSNGSTVNLCVDSASSNSPAVSIGSTTSNVTTFEAMNAGRIMFGNDTSTSTGMARISGGTLKGFLVSINGAAGQFLSGTTAMALMPTGAINFGNSTAGDTNGATFKDHYLASVQSTAPTCGTGCASIAAGSTDTSGRLTVSSGTITSIALTWGLAHATAPIACTVNAATSSGSPVAAAASVPTATGVTFVAASAVGGGTVGWGCI